MNGLCHRGRSGKPAMLVYKRHPHWHLPHRSTMCGVLGPVAATGAEVDEGQENPEVPVTGDFPRHRLLFPD